MTDTRRAAVYTRISRDRDGTGLAVERQRDEARALIERRGWTVAGEWSDPNITGSGRKARPGFRALLGAIGRGEISAVVAWDLPRLARNPRDRLALVEACRDQGVIVALVRGSDMDPTTASGRLLIGLLGEVAEHELGIITERIQSQKSQAVEQGRYRGGRRPFGYEPDGVTVRQAEAEIVREATDRVLAGESLHSVARDLNGRGLTTSTGRPWRNVAVRDLILRARNAGYLERHHDEAARSEILGPASWPAIVDEPRWRSARRLLTAPGRRQARSADEVWLGSGVYVCGVCGDTMRAARTPSRRGGERVQVPAYRCRTAAHLTSIAEPLDAFVTDVVLERLSREDAKLLLTPQNRRADLERLHAERADAEGSLADLAALVADRTFTAAEARDAVAGLRATVDRLDGEITAAGSVSPLAGIADSGDVRAAWGAATVGRHKAVLRALMTVTLLPAGKGRPAGWSPGGGRGYFDPSRVRIDWHP